MNVTVSVGMCIFPDCARDADSLLKNADAAMYEAKESGRNSFHVFNEGMVEATADKLEFEHDLRHALDNGELSLHYQPQVSCIIGRCDRDGGAAALEPSQARADRAGAVYSSGGGDGADRADGRVGDPDGMPRGQGAAGYAGADIVIAVNLSPRQFRQKNLPALVERALQDSRLAPHSLEIEITEQTLMTNSATTMETLMQLRKLGVKIAIDDFGTGFSSFSYLLQYEVDRLKIDRSFVNRSADDPTAAAIVRAIISMAHGLNLKVVAEGVETNEQLNFLLRRRCDEAQGFFFGRPVPAELIAQSARAIERRAADSGVRATA